MHHAVRPQREWRGNSSDSAPIHHPAMAETCTAISTLAHTSLPQPCCFSPFPIQHAFSFPLLISYLSSFISITLPLPLYHTGLSSLSLSTAVIHPRFERVSHGGSWMGKKSNEGKFLENLNPCCCWGVNDSYIYYINVITIYINFFFVLITIQRLLDVILLCTSAF